MRPAERQLLVDGKVAPLGARAFDLLVALIERRDRVVSKPELFEAVWPGLVVEENNLQVQVSSLRKLLGSHAIATIPNRGYRFVAPVDVEARQAMATRSPWIEANPNNLPQARTRFIGRESALADCASLLRDTRLLTLSGIGGCGKTRLAQELAQRQLAAFPDGVWFVDLGPLQEAQRVSATVASTLGVQGSAGPPLGRLTDHLKSRRTLVVLDNCEHVIDAAVESIEAMLGACSTLKVIATSREALGMTGEQVFAVRSLSLPASTDVDEMRKSEAVRLFVDHARLVVPEFDVDERNAAAIAEICRRLDGIALAVELAAARVRVLSVEDIRARLDDRFRLLTGGSRAMPRHQTLQATMQWSHDLLTLPERRLFRRLAVFAGGCTLAAAAHVADDGADEYDTLERLTALHDKSLLLVDRDSHALPRYRMLETVRQYAEERLNEAGEGEAIRTRHLREYVELAEAAAPGLKGLHGAGWVARLGQEQENLLAALAWSPHAHGGSELGLRLIGSAWRYWVFASQPERGYRLARAALDLAGDGPDTRERCTTEYAAVSFAVAIGRYEDAQACAERCLAMARRLDDRGLIADGLIGSAIGRASMGDAAGALARFSEAREIARALDDAERLSTALHGMAEMHRSLGELAAAEPLFEESLALTRLFSDGRGCYATLCSLASLSIATDQPARARAALSECVAVARANSYKGLTACTLDVCATLAASLGELAAAARFHGAALARLHEARQRHEPVDDEFIAPRIGSARAAMGDAAFDAVVEEGKAWSYDISVAEMEKWLDLPGTSTNATPRSPMLNVSVTR